MLCEECGEREATVVLSFLAAGGKTTRHLCAECMKSKQKELILGNIGALLGSVLNAAQGRQSPTAEKVCPQCGCSLTDFKNTGRLGCPGCYKVFREELMPIVKGSSEGAFRGKKPDHQPETTSPVLSMTLDNLKEKMLQAVAQEDYETAARIRDEIRSLNEKEGVETP